MIRAMRASGISELDALVQMCEAGFGAFCRSLADTANVRGAADYYKSREQDLYKTELLKVLTEHYGRPRAEQVIDRLSNLQPLPSTADRPLQRPVPESTAPSKNMGDYSNQSLKDARFRGANLVGANFQSANLQRAVYKQANATKANFQEATLYDSVCAGGTFYEADFSNADLSKADFKNADLREADFSNADLSKADFRNADLRNANLSGAKLFRTWVSGADFSGANLDGAQLFRCWDSSKTIWPIGYSRPKR